jgi:hypothetical protein
MAEYKGELTTAAVAIHEIYISYMNAGFTAAQALELIKAHIAASVPGKQ